MLGYQCPGWLSTKSGLVDKHLCFHVGGVILRCVLYSLLGVPHGTEPPLPTRLIRIPSTAFCPFPAFIPLLDQ